MEKPLPVRRHTRLKEYDYSTPGAYFVTICTQDRKPILSHIVGRGLAPAEVVLSDFGRIAEEQLLSLEGKYRNLTIDQYVIMPNHIHVICILEEAAGASPRPTLMDMICTYKSLTTKECKKAGFVGKLFQTSFYDHIIRGQKDYDEIAEYVVNNPKQWELDSLYIQP